MNKMNQKGIAPILIISMVALVGVGFYLGITFQKSDISSTEQNIEPSISPTVELTITGTPKLTSKLTTTPTPTPTPTSVLSGTNTSDSNLPTSIKISSPNGGESFKVGDTMRITWSSNNLNRSGSCIVKLVYENNSSSTSWAPVNTPVGSEDWKLTSESGDHQAKVDIECYDDKQTRVHDQSDNYFVVNN